MTRPLLLVCLLLLATACTDSHTAPVAPSGLPNGSTGAPPALVNLSGTVYEYTPAGRRSLPNVPLDVSVDFQAWPPQLTSDAEGRYGILKAPMSALKVRAEAPGYSQPCRAGAILDRDTTLDVHLVSDTLLTSTGPPPSMPVAERRISGRVFERTPAGTQPISGSRIIGDFSAGFGWAPSATTLTDATGSYLLCGLEGDLGVELNVSKAGYAGATVHINLGLSTTYDIELKHP